MGQRYSCIEKEACELLKLNPPKAEISWVYPENWTKDYQVYCDKAKIRNYSKSIITVEGSTFMFFTLIFSDILGRKTLVQFGAIVIITCMILTALIDGFLPRIASVGIAVGTEAAFPPLFFMLIYETSRKIKKFKKLKNFKKMKKNYNYFSANYQT